MGEATLVVLIAAALQLSQPATACKQLQGREWTCAGAMGVDVGKIVQTRIVNVY